MSDHNLEPIQNEDAEVAVLAAVLQDADCIPIVRERLKPSDFHNPKIAAAIRAVFKIADKGDRLGADTLAATMRAMEVVGPEADFLLSIADPNTHFRTAATVEYDCDRVANAAILRRLALEGETLVHDARQAHLFSRDAAELLEQVRMRFVRIETPANETKPDPLRDLPLGELGPSEPPDWIWTNYAARGCITLLSAAPKAGKTTLVRSLLKDLYRTGGMIEAPPLTKPTLIVSEEPMGQWARHRESFGLDPELVRVIPCPFMAKPSWAEWDQAIARIARRAEELGAAVVIFDTLSNLWPVQDENDSAQVNRALMPIRAISETGAAVILVHHDRKGGGAYGEGARGSSAITGFPDAILTLRRFRPEDETDTRRRLSYVGRFDDTEPEVILEFTGDGYTYSGRPADVQDADLMRLIADTLPDDGGRLDFSAIYAEARESIGKTKLRDLLARGVETGRWERSGSGRKGDGFTYARPKCVSIVADPIRTKRIKAELPERREAI